MSRLGSHSLTRDSEGNALYSRAYTFNAVSNVTQVVEGGVTTSYTYDAINQLTEESRSGYTATYTYDANGNRLTKTLNSVTENYSYDSADKLLSAGSKTYDYDDAGRTTEVTSGGVTTYLAYDYEGRVTQISRSGSTTNTFEYNGQDTRVSKTDSAGGGANDPIRLLAAFRLVADKVFAIEVDGALGQVGAGQMFLRVSSGRIYELLGRLVQGVRTSHRVEWRLRLFPC